MYLVFYLNLNHVFTWLRDIETSFEVPNYLNTEINILVIQWQLLESFDCVYIADPIRNIQILRNYEEWGVIDSISNA